MFANERFFAAVATETILVEEVIVYLRAAIFPTSVALGVLAALIED